MSDIYTHIHVYVYMYRYVQIVYVSAWFVFETESDRDPVESLVIRFLSRHTCMYKYVHMCTHIYTGIHVYIHICLCIDCFIHICERSTTSCGAISPSASCVRRCCAVTLPRSVP